MAFYYTQTPLPVNSHWNIASFDDMALKTIKWLITDRSLSQSTFKGSFTKQSNDWLLIDHSVNPHLKVALHICDLKTKYRWQDVKHYHCVTKQNRCIAFLLFITLKKDFPHILFPNLIIKGLTFFNQRKFKMSRFWNLSLAY